MEIALYIVCGLLIILFIIGWCRLCWHYPIATGIIALLAALSGGGS